MEITSDLYSRMNSVRHIFLRSLTESGINQLHLVVEEAVVNEAKRGKMQLSASPEPLAFLRESSAPIESIEGCLAFRLYWKRYAAYLVTEECVGSCGNYADEVFEGDRLRRYSKSHFLDHLARDTGAHSRPLIHFKIICENHLVDVAAEDLPEIEMVQSFDRDWIHG